MDKETTIITHSGDFHTDDIFAVATVVLVTGEKPYRIVRTRDMNVIETGDYVVDVGRIYDPATKRFDHHQGNVGTHENGIPYSAFGLVWKEFGKQLCGENEAAAKIIEQRIVVPIDAGDNGIETYNKKELLRPYLFHNIGEVFAPTWKENAQGINHDGAFGEMVEIAVRILKREIISATDILEGEKYVEEAYQKAEDKRIIILDKRYPWEYVLKKYPEPLFIVKPDSQSSGGQWTVKTVRSDPDSSFASRKDLPESWGGKSGAALAEVTGIPDAIFCHAARFIIVTGSKESAIKLARLAVDNKE
jgi:uncharacterized UPF0160 family protein